jgi:hypothetical protein
MFLTTNIGYYSDLKTHYYFYIYSSPDLTITSSIIKHYQSVPDRIKKIQFSSNRLFPEISQDY